MIASFEELNEECLQFADITERLKEKGLPESKKSALVKDAMKSLQHIYVDSKVSLEMITECNGDEE